VTWRSKSREPEPLLLEPPGSDRQLVGELFDRELDVCNRHRRLIRRAALQELASDQQLADVIARRPQPTSRQPSTLPSSSHRPPGATAAFRY
jgi:hypothetical protein